jgi:hypothetical protein
MAHFVICPYCKGRFDRDKEEYAVISARRYAHAACMLREAEKDPNYVKKEIVDPLDNVICTYCKKPMSKKDANCVMIGNNKYVHKECQALEENREKTDREKLEEYIKELFSLAYIEPRVKAQIKKYVEEYNYTYSGMQKALYYFYEVKGGDKSKANGGIGIIPYVYQDAYNYHYNLWLAQQKNKDVEIQLYIPKVKEIVIPRPERKIKKRQLFVFLDEEENDNGI